MIKIGFILLTHGHPQQALALTRALTELYDGPPIVCHHDFTQCALDKSLFPRNVHFVEPCFRTSWGCFEIVPATLAAIRILMGGKGAPDWFYLLSGSDYPATSPDRVRELLATTHFDAFIDHREIAWPAEPQKPPSTDSGGFCRPSYHALAYKRYCAVAVPRPSRSKPMALQGRFYLRHPLWRAIIPGPFSARFRCYAGEHWFTANRKAADVLLRNTPETARLLTHLRRRESPEECFYHSVLANAPLELNPDNLRYIDWPSADSWHPKTLTPDDLPAICASGAHFARKIGPASALIEELNKQLGIKSQPFSAICIA
jgi:hypothetical protein